ncbi:hypothetical protein HYC85_013753 [Camellia sinensis]|uniref:Uncharacterized protein n=1 Tax=Camellia sinensis TaxID=4442 RepID=A0A7J7H7M8_CAMSI|nr:hypothetical protein HYC85_013753 [Camellia sinensis]
MEALILVLIFYERNKEKTWIILSLVWENIELARPSSLLVIIPSAVNVAGETRHILDLEEYVSIVGKSINNLIHAFHHRLNKTICKLTRISTHLKKKTGLRKRPYKVVFSPIW